MATTSKYRTFATIDHASIRELRTALGGDLLLPQDLHYDQSRSIWNGMIERSPGCIVRPSDEVDVQRCVGFAAAHDLPLAIKGGGHNVAGHALCDGGMVLDLSSMRAVGVDPDRRRVWVQGGATWADLDGATARFGLATTGGVISTTGVGGLTLGGGIGWLVGAHGMAIDNLRSANVVTAGGDIVHTDEQAHPDLFWALRGGGGNFGVVTTFEFEVYPLTEVFAGFLAFPVDRAPSVLARYRDLTDIAPDALTAYAELSFDPDSGTRLVAIGFCYPGPADEVTHLMAPLRSLEPIAEQVGVMPYVSWQQAFDQQFPAGRRYYWKSHLLEYLDDTTIDSIVDFGMDPPIPLYNITIEWYRGPMNRVDPGATAFPHRHARFQVIALAQSEDPADDEISRSWARAVHRTIAPAALDGAFLNFNSVDRDERTAAYRAGYGVNWARLLDVKRRYDPDNVFRYNNNIDPHGA